MYKITQRVRQLPRVDIANSLRKSFAVEIPMESKLSLDQVKQVRTTDLKLRLQHLAFENDLDPALRDEVRRKRMIYRSKQRGWLEVDLLLGSWAAENIPKLSEEELDQFDVILEEETIDIFQYMSGQEGLPKHLEELPLMQKLKNYSYTKNIKSPEEYAKLKVSANLT